MHDRPLGPANPDVALLSPVLRRRSYGRLCEPGPDEVQLQLLLAAGASAPDHGRLRPWRFVVFQNESREKFGRLLASALRERVKASGGEPTESQLQKEQGKLLRAPLVIAVCARVDNQSSIPAIEQVASAAAACENMLIAATAMGFGSKWRTGDPTYDPEVKSALGIREQDHIVGWLYFGTPVTRGNDDIAREGTVPEVIHWNAEI